MQDIARFMGLLTVSCIKNYSISYVSLKIKWFDLFWMYVSRKFAMQKC